jgi:MFS family permease
MPVEDDEFKDVQKGLPTENTAQRSGAKFMLIFVIGGIIIAGLVLLFGGVLQALLGSGFIVPQILMTGSISLLLGALQAWIFRAKIKSRLYVFIAVSLFGGLVGGFVGGLLLDSGLEVSFIIGAINGLLAGGISSLAQNKLMGNKKYGFRWFLYNSISWAFIFAMAWIIGWSPMNIALVALAAGFLMVASGISLVAFLRSTPQIEFS